MTIKRTAVILSGCGVYDGSEIHEAVLTLLHLARHGIKISCFAPDIAQKDVVHHITEKALSEERNVLTESARLFPKGPVKSLSQLDPEAYDSIILPGGFGLAKNLTDFLAEAGRFQIRPLVFEKLVAFRDAGKPIGLICIAPVMAGHLFGAGVRCTVAGYQPALDILNTFGVEHIDCSATEVVIDEKHRLVTTPAYLCAAGIAEVSEGINKLVSHIQVMMNNSTLTA